eukprot:m.222996 g.222996  ORF g.222996 m.222996 type:complete len:354 (-) comp15941_c0_seq10:2200-3261(-)
MEVNLLPRESGSPDVSRQGNQRQRNLEDEETKEPIQTFSQQPQARVAPITDVFKCMICLGKLLDAHLCPHCSKMGCLKCVNRWILENPEKGCPHCRNPITTESMVRCRWATEVTSKLGELERSLGEGEAAADICKLHGLAIDVYCNTCKQPICHSCALWSEKHRGHDTGEFNKVYDEHVRQLSKKLHILRTRQKHLYALMRDVKSNAERIRENHEQATKKVHDWLDKVRDNTIRDLDAQLRSKLSVVMARKDALSAQASKLEKLLANIDQELQSNARSKLVRRNTELIEMFQEVYLCLLLVEIIQLVLDSTTTYARFWSRSDMASVQRTIHSATPAGLTATEALYVFFRTNLE